MIMTSYAEHLKGYRVEDICVKSNQQLNEGQEEGELQRQENERGQRKEERGKGREEKGKRKTEKGKRKKEEEPGMD